MGRPDFGGRWPTGEALDKKRVLSKRKGPGARYSYAVPDTGPMALPAPSVPLTAVSSLVTPAAAAEPEAQLPAPLEAPVPVPPPAVTESVKALAVG